MKALARRGFLKALAAAPVALPVAAKEAAASMGLSGPITGAGYSTDHGSPIGLPAGANAGEDGPVIDHFKKALQMVDSARGQRQIREDARYAARCLDSDLASMRSVSPAWAHRQQIERTVIDTITKRRAYIMDELAEHMKRKVGF